MEAVNQPLTTPGTLYNLNSPQIPGRTVMILVRCSGELSLRLSPKAVLNILYAKVE